MGPAQVVFDLGIKDDTSGFYSGNLLALSPVVGQRRQFSFNTHPSFLKSGDANDGVYQITTMFPRYSEYGEWTIYQVYLRDKVTNTEKYLTPFPDDAGFPVIIYMDGAVPGGGGVYKVPVTGGVIESDDGDLALDFPPDALTPRHRNLNYRDGQIRRCTDRQKGKQC